jgi:predicted kinase
MAGLPATGKTTVARALARALGGVHLRLDTIEQAVVRSGVAGHPLGPVGYVVGYALAGDLLRQGLTVVADSVNPLAVTRDAWRDVARAAGVAYVDVEVVCSDRDEHRHRAGTRVGDIPGLALPAWEQIEAREYEPWDRDRIVVDTAGRDVDACVTELVDALKRW